MHAKPRRVVRFKRNLLIGVAATGSVFLLGIAWLALGSRATKPVPQEQFNVRPEPKPEAITSLPSAYDKIKLGAPLPGDLGHGVVALEKGLGLSSGGNSFVPNPEEDAARAERIRLAQQARQAAESGVFVQIVAANPVQAASSAAAPSSATPSANNPHSALISPMTRTPKATS